MNKLSKYLKYLFIKQKRCIIWSAVGTRYFATTTATKLKLNKTSSYGTGISINNDAFVINDSDIKFVKVSVDIGGQSQSTSITPYFIFDIQKNGANIISGLAIYSRGGAHERVSETLLLQVTQGDTISVSVKADSNNSIYVTYNSTVCVDAIY